MPAESETLRIIIQLRDEANRNLAKLNQTLKKTQTQASRTSRAFTAFRSGLTRIRRSVLNMRTALVAAGAAFAAFAAGKRFITAAQEQAKSVEGLNAALQAMGRFTPELSQNLQDVASGLQQVTNFGDEATIEGQKFLVTYKNITDDLLPRTSAAMADIAALTGGDMVAAANLLGKASLGMTDSLKRVGIDVDKATFKAEGFVGVLRQIETQVKGQAEAQRRATGSTIALGNSWGDVQEKLGEVLKIGIEPFIRVVVEEVDKLNEYLARLKKEGQLDDWARNVSDVLLTTFEVIVKGIALVGDAWRGWQQIWLGLKAAFSVLMEFMFLGLSKLSELIDDVRREFVIFGEGWGDTLKLLKEFPPTSGYAELLEMLGAGDSKIGEQTARLKEQSLEWGKLSSDTGKQLIELQKQDLYYSRADNWLKGIRKRVEEYADEIGKAEDPVKKLTGGDTSGEQSAAVLAAKLKSAAQRAIAAIQTELVKEEDLFKRGITSLEDYFAKRLELTRQQAAKEIEILQQAATTEADPAKRLAIEDKIFQRKEKLAQDEIKIAEDKANAINEIEESRAQVDQSLFDLRQQLAEAGGAGILERQQLEREALERTQAERYQSLVDQHATEAQLQDASNLAILEKDQLLAKQRKAIHDLTITNIQGSLSQLSEAFGDAYAASGQKIKAFFYLQKGVAIAQAGIQTYQNAIIAYQRGLEIPYVGAYLAPVFAAVAVAAGLARIAAIRNQSVAEGGKIKGYSPTDTSDNILANVTAGEYVQPVKTVRHYGVEAMEAIRRRLIPKEVLAGYKSPKVLRGTTMFQAGGTVSPRAAGAAAAAGGVTPEAQQPININNIIDPQMMDQYVATKPGQRNIMNVMSQNAFQLKQIILGEE